VSLASARSGVIQRRRVRGASGFVAAGLRAGALLSSRAGPSANAALVDAVAWTLEARTVRALAAPEGFAIEALAFAAAFALFLRPAWADRFFRACAVSASASSSGPPSAARVLPLPVGVTSSPDSPRRQRRQASRWKGAGFHPCASNQSASGASKRVRAPDLAS